MNDLNRSQRKIAKLVMGMIAPFGFALVGGRALIEAKIVSRQTYDLDAFTNDRNVDVAALGADVAAMLLDQGYVVDAQPQGRWFCRLFVSTGKYRRSTLKVELGYDFRLFDTIDSSLGPSISVREMAANKLLAAFDRSAPRDLCDLYDLSKIVPMPQAADDAKAKDAGFTAAALEESIMRTLDLPASEWPGGEVDATVVRFARSLVRSLRR